MPGLAWINKCLDLEILEKTLKFVKKMPMLSKLLLVLAMSVFIYWDFLRSGISFLLTVGDGIDQTWPFHTL